jgi:hypothetical protein
LQSQFSVTASSSITPFQRRISSLIICSGAYFRIRLIKHASALAAAASARSAAASALSAEALASAAAISAFRAAWSALAAEAADWSAKDFASSAYFLQAPQQPAPKATTNAKRIARAKPFFRKAFLIMYPPFS